MKYIISITLLLLTACTAVSKDSLDSSVSLCRVQSDRDKYDGKYITFRAQISSDGLESTSLWDPECRDFSLSVDQIEGNANWDEVNKIIYGIGNIGTMDKVLSTDIYGVFHKAPHNGKVSVIYMTNIKYSMGKGDVGKGDGGN